MLVLFVIALVSALPSLLLVRRLAMLVSAFDDIVVDYIVYVVGMSYCCGVVGGVVVTCCLLVVSCVDHCVVLCIDYDGVVACVCIRCVVIHVIVVGVDGVCIVVRCCVDVGVVDVAVVVDVVSCDIRCVVGGVMYVVDSCGVIVMVVVHVVVVVVVS